MQTDGKTTAELVTLTLAGCLISINGDLSLGESTALSLGVVDRENIIKELAERNPGPRLGEVSKTCETCGGQLFIPLSLVDFFRF